MLSSEGLPHPWRFEWWCFPPTAYSHKGDSGREIRREVTHAVEQDGEALLAFFLQAST